MSNSSTFNSLFGTEDDEETEDMLLAQGLMPQLDVEMAVDLMKFNDYKKRKDISDDDANHTTKDEYDGTEP